MTKVKKVFGVAFATLFTLFTFFSYAPVQAASNAKTPIIPQVQFLSTPTTEYTAGDRVRFDISTPNYGKKVEYRVVLWNNSTKSYSDLWNASNGYPNRYYTKWQPWGNNVFTLGWPILEPGSYRITVYVKRVGVANNKAYLKGMNCDSYKESVAFTVKPNMSVLDKDGQTYGSNDASNPLTIKNDVNITAKNVILNNANVEGNINITGDNATLNNITATGKIFVDPGKDGSTTLENVTAKAIEVLSGGTNSIHIKNVKSDSLVVNSTNPVRIETDGDTEIVSTTANGYVIFDKKSGTFGTITITKDESGETVVEFRGDIQDKVVVETQATIKTSEGSKLENLVIATENSTDKVVLQGAFSNVEVSKPASVEIAKGTTVTNVDVKANAQVAVANGATVQTLDTNNNTVALNNQGTVTNQENTGGTSPAPSPDDSSSGGNHDDDDEETPDTNENEDLNDKVENLISLYDLFYTQFAGTKFINFDTKALNNVQTNTINVTINSAYKTESLKNLMYIPIEKLAAHGRLDSPVIGTAFTLINDFAAGVQAGSGNLNQYVISKLNTKLEGEAYLEEAIAFVTTPNVITYNALYDAIGDPTEVVNVFKEIFPSGTVLGMPVITAYGLTLESVSIGSYTVYTKGSPVDMSVIPDYDSLTVNYLVDRTVEVKFSKSGVNYYYNVKVK